MQSIRLTALACAACLPSLGCDDAAAQNFPTRPIRLVTGGAGGGNDIAARLIADGLTGLWGQQVIVDNRPSGLIPGEVVSRAAPDGYMLVISGRSFWIAPLSMGSKAPYDPVKDFAPVTLPASTANVLAVHPSLPVRSVKDLIALAKARPGQLNYGAAGQGSSPHLAAEVFKSQARLDIVRINYRAMGGLYTDLMAGQVQLTFGSAPSVMPYVKSGRLHGLAVTSAQPSALAPGLPTVAASGLPGYEFVSPFGVFAPGETPRAIVSKLNEGMVRALSRPDLKERLFNAGMEVVASTPEQLGTMIKADMTALGPIVKDLPGGGG